jgi:phosphatidylglycerophosphate synthase
MPRPRPTLVIDAHPRGPNGPLARERLLDRPILAHLLDQARALAAAPIIVHVQENEYNCIRELVDHEVGPALVFATGPLPEGVVILRTDRVYDTVRLRRIIGRGHDPEGAVIWRLDSPSSLASAEEEWIRRRTYQPLGRYWALEPARYLARWLRPTFVRPNALTLASAALMLFASALIACRGSQPLVGFGAAIAMALALVLDTADGHLARLQGTATDFGRWLDAVLDECGDMVLHAAVAWSAFARDGWEGWLVAGMLYGMGKYVFFFASQEVSDGHEPGRGNPVSRRDWVAALRSPHVLSWWRWAGHADVRWHLWIVLAALGRLDAELLVFTAYYPARALASAWRKAVRLG